MNEDTLPEPQAPAGEGMPAGDGALLQDGAVAQDGTAGQIVEFLSAGGPVVAILLALSVVALALIVVKLWQFRATRYRDSAVVEYALRLHRGGRTATALQALRKGRSPVAQVLGQALAGCQRKDLPEALVREEVTRIAVGEVEDLRSLLRPLEVIAAVAPLLGLFGTVLGMIDAFQELEQAGNNVNPAVLSGGIWEALLTTAVGLAVAVPVVMVLNWFERIVERTSHTLDDVVTRAFTRGLEVGVEDEAEIVDARTLNAG